MKTRICVAIQAETTDQTIKDLLDTEQADLIELRLDYRKETLNLERIRFSTVKPLIATNRRKDQGGKAEESEKERLKLLYNAVDAGFDFIDISSVSENLTETVSSLQKKGAKVIVSFHNFEHPLSTEELEEKHLEIAETGCDVIKIIGWTNTHKDNLPYLEYNKKHPGNVSFGMGQTGTTSRILAPLSGSFYTYASLETGKELAPGQIPLNQLKEIYGSIKQ
jgi:3-dehydroquinate dehydratase/shikimate dehydrogenase